MTSKSVAAPGVKGKKAVLEGPELDGPRAATFKSACMRMSFLAQDRPDIQFVAKEAARAMARPTVAAFESLKHLTRFLIGQPRLVWVWQRQSPGAIGRAVTDADHAGCYTTRRSTSGMFLFHGKHLIRSSSTTQSTIAISVGEAEFNSGVKGAAGVLGLKSMAHDLGVELVCQLETDSSSSIGTCSRRGAGKLRHIETPMLWIQHIVAQRRLVLKKIAGVVNGSDMLTKILDRKTLTTLFPYSGLEWRSGVHRDALEAQ